MRTDPWKSVEIRVLEKLRAEEFPVQEGDVVNRDQLGAFDFAGVRIGAGAEAFGVHLGNHGENALFALRLPLWHFGEMRYFRSCKEHRRSIFTCRYAGAALNAGRRLESGFRQVFRNRERIRLWSSTRLH